MDITIIAAMAENRVIGKNGKLPWYIPSETKHFHNTIKGGVTISGRVSFEEFTPYYKGDHDRILVSSSLKQNTFPQYSNLEKAIKHAKTYDKEIYLTGGARIYTEGLNYANKMILTTIFGEYEGDTKFPQFNEDDWLINKVVNEKKYSIVYYNKK